MIMARPKTIIHELRGIRKKYTKNDVKPSIKLTEKKLSKRNNESNIVTISLLRWSVRMIRV